MNSSGMKRSFPGLAESVNQALRFIFRGPIHEQKKYYLLISGYSCGSVTPFDAMALRLWQKTYSPGTRQNGATKGKLHRRGTGPSRGDVSAAPRKKLEEALISQK